MRELANTSTERNDLIITPRLLGIIWKSFEWHGLFMNNPDTPLLAHFLAYYERPVQNPVFSWYNKAKQLTYRYDLSINQVEVTPSVQPELRWESDANKYLWKILPPEWLEANGNWKPIWFKAAERWEIAPILFILEQGFDVNTTDELGRTALYYVVGPFGGRLDLVELLVEAGADLSLPNNTVDILLERSQEGLLGRIEIENAALITSYLQSL
ncbi:hypothetical protein IC229_24590 [Spirosoma sp. BT702]|uniref:Ankyrin repeat domain-containing protein n=1 Tax=Spirosoma profusum TaxID=2771354 RepID=A0A926Y3A1_9BACT|nr:ankyrin repeat domain-containing protein [Spirosoma profusum]MBD2703847.1 hypothetical protein [Spirosoma profusum]